MPTEQQTLEYEDEELEAAPRGPGIYVLMAAHAPSQGSVCVPLEDVNILSLARGSSTRVERESGRNYRLVIADSWMSGTHARITRNGTGFTLEDAGSKNGTLDAEAQKIETSCPLTDGMIFAVGRTLLLFRSQVAHRANMVRSRDLTPPDPDLATFCPSFVKATEAMQAVAASTLPVLILGETGTGKEVAARAMHRMSGRTGRFIAVNCGGIPEGLLESELFGVIKGAFSGAHADREGLVLAAHEGTLFLDEIGELPATAQSSLLRVLQERCVVAVGGTQAQDVDFRLVAATHRDLAAATIEGEFREDLLARLSGLEVHLPPLRDRIEDFGLLIGRLLETQGSTDATLTLRAALRLAGHTWPHNIRELGRALEVGLALAGMDPVKVEHLPPNLRQADAQPKRLLVPLSPEDLAIKQKLVAALEAHGGNVSAVARDLEKARMQIHRWMKRFNLIPESFR